MAWGRLILRSTRLRELVAFAFLGLLPCMGIAGDSVRLQDLSFSRFFDAGAAKHFLVVTKEGSEIVRAPIHEIPEGAVFYRWGRFEGDLASPGKSGLIAKSEILKASLSTKSQATGGGLYVSVDSLSTIGYGTRGVLVTIPKRIYVLEVTPELDSVLSRSILKWQSSAWPTLRDLLQALNVGGMLEKTISTGSDSGWLSFFDSSVDYPARALTLRDIFAGAEKTIIKSDRQRFELFYALDIRYPLLPGPDLLKLCPECQALLEGKVLPHSTLRLMRDGFVEAYNYANLPKELLEVKSSLMIALMKQLPEDEYGQELRFLRDHWKLSESDLHIENQLCSKLLGAD